MRENKIPVCFRTDTAAFNEIQWRILRESCRKLNCDWSFDEDGVPIYPKDCSSECREYLERHAGKIE